MDITQYFNTYKKELVFPKNFNESIENVKWPDSLKTINFGNRFNQPIEDVKWPDSLEIIYYFTKSIIKIDFNYN